MMLSKRWMYVGQTVILWTAGVSAQASYVPWDALQNDSWIYTGAPQTRISMYTVNGGSYEIGFAAAKNDGSATGMNALEFDYGGVRAGHLASVGYSDSFTVYNAGSKSFDDLLLLVAIDAASLPGDFGLSLGVSGEAPYEFDAAVDFAFYHPTDYDTYRPGGYYSGTTPSSEGVGYDFNHGMVSILAVPGVNLASSGGTITFDYVVQNLPGKAVFSVYGYRSSVGYIQHTNRALLDAYNPDAYVSTFEIIPEPSSLLLMVLGVGVAAKRKRRRMS